jgi:glycosyltransferase involved in cell wall biosynthesis
MTRRRVLLVQPSLQPPGGGNGVAAWMAQALAPHHDLTILSWWPVQVEPINRFFGTSLRTRDFRALVVPAAWRVTIDSLPVPSSLLRSSVLMRYTRRLAGHYDVVIGAHNETDYGRRGIQYVHYPAYLRPRPHVDLRWYHIGPLLEGYYRLADAVAGFSLERMRRNLTLANSHWTAERIRRSLGIDATTVYPPVVGSDEGPEWDARLPGFLAMGRISTEKEYERVINILAIVKRHQPEVSLTIVGTLDRATRRYFNDLKALTAARDATEWVTFRNDLSRDEVGRLIASNRYGIHGMREEHFGMAPAEMVRGGMIVWVPNGGGQTEIVGDAPLLRYDTEQQAAEQIVTVMRDTQRQRAFRDHLRRMGESFSVDRFVREIQSLVANFEP